VLSGIKKNFHLWIPDLFESKGGIQVYSKFLLEALLTSYPNANYDVFIKNDSHPGKDLSKKNLNFYYSGNLASSLRTLGFAAKIISLGLWKRPNLIIVSHLNFAPIAYWLKHTVGIPYWVMTYGIEAWDIEKPALKMGLHHAEQILCISNYTRDRLIKEQNLDPSKISLLPCTFDPSLYEIAPKPAYLLEQYKLNQKQPIILTVARLAEEERYKGYDQILKALPQISQVIPNIHYIIAGKGNDRLRIEQLIDKLNLEECVTLAGFVPDEQLCDYYNLCDVFAMPSKKEGFGIVYLEALACGKPTLAGNQDGAIDALCQGDLGALVNPDDIEEIAQTIIKILQGTYPNPALYQPELLRQKVIDIYGLERFKETLHIYLEEFLMSLDLKNI